MNRKVLLVSAGLMISACAIHAPVLEPLPGPAPRGRTLEEVGAQKIDLGRPLDAEALAAIAVYTNPDLIAFRAAEDVSRAQVFAAGLFPDPEFSFGIEQPLSGAGLVTAIAGALGIDLAKWMARPYAIKEAKAKLESLRYDIVWAEWLTGEQARLLALRIAYLKQAKSLTAEFRGLAEEGLARGLAAVSRGDLPTTSLEALRLAASDAADRDRGSESRLAVARGDLNRLLGIDPTEEVPIAPPPPAKAIPDPDVLFSQAVDKRADLAGLRAAYASSHPALAASRLGRYPIPVVSLSGSRDTGNIKSLGPGISLSLPLWNRGRGNVAVVQATAKQARAEYAARLETIRSDIAAAHRALEIARKQLADVTRDIVPLIPMAEAADRAARAGDLAMATARATRLALLDKQILANDLAQTAAEYEIALEIASGQRLEVNK